MTSFIHFSDAASRENETLVDKKKMPDLIRVPAIVHAEHDDIESAPEITTPTKQHVYRPYVMSPSKTWEKTVRIRGENPHKQDASLNKGNKKFLYFKFLLILNFSLVLIKDNKYS